MWKMAGIEARLLTFFPGNEDTGVSSYFGVNEKSSIKYMEYLTTWVYGTVQIFIFVEKKPPANINMFPLLFLSYFHVLEFPKVQF